MSTLSCPVASFGARSCCEKKKTPSRTAMHPRPPFDRRQRVVFPTLLRGAQLRIHPAAEAWCVQLLHSAQVAPTCPPPSQPSVHGASSSARLAPLPDRTVPQRSLAAANSAARSGAGNPLAVPAIDGEEAELPRPPAPTPAPAPPAPPTWLCRGCGRADTQFSDPVTLQCQHRAGRQAGCCWHIACLRTAEERAVARRVLILPHSRYACPQHRRGVPPVGRGMGRHETEASTPAATSRRAPR